MSILRDILLWFVRLLPGNPILTRVVAQGSRRSKHLWARAAYLGILFFVVVMNGGVGGNDASLAESAKKATQVFLVVSVAQLLLMSFIAPIFCAGAITQEKDSNTYNILLTTPLSSAQIVLGSLFSRIYFVWVLLLSGLPVFCITMIFGGVTTAEVFQSFGLAATTALITGSIAIMISFLKVGTRRTIFYFFAGVAAYLLAVGALGLSAYGQLPEAPLGEPAFGMGTRYRMSWLAPMQPFLALMVVTGQTPAPALSDVYAHGWPARYFLAYPQYGYMLLTTLLSAFMVFVSILFVRRSEHEGESTLAGRLATGFRRAKVEEERTRQPRRVWRNPIAWREAATRGSASGGPWVRWAILGIGLTLGFVLWLVYQRGTFQPLNPQAAPQWLTALVWVEMAIVVLVVTTTAASTLTRERESQTMEILLTTPLTAKYIVAGMLQGLVRYVIPLIAIPAGTLALFYLGDLVRGRSGATTLESLVFVPLLLLSVAALAAMTGLYCSLIYKRTVQAVMISTSIVLGLLGVAWACGAGVSGAGLTVTSVVYPFLPFPAIQALIDPDLLVAQASGGYGAAPISPEQALGARFTRMFFSLVAIAVYGGVTFALYRNVVSNFDMTIRRQST